MVLTDFLARQPDDEAAPRMVDGGIVTAAVAALAMGEPVEFALICELPKNQPRPALPDFARFGYAVDAESGEILRLGAGPVPAERHLFASLRLAIPAAVGAELEDLRRQILDVLEAVAANGWALRIGRRLATVRTSSVPAIRARPEALPMIAAGAVAGAVDGAGVLVGAVDFGCDFAHPAFRLPDGSTRLRFLWDQNGATAPGATVPGRMYSRQEIDTALATETPIAPAAPLAQLGYEPDDNLYIAVGTPDDAPVHGTHVLGIAAGRAVPPPPGRPDPGCPAGVAPGTDLAFVHLRPGALVTDGEPADVLDGVCAIFAEADLAGIPSVVNLSLGANFGPHDGSTLLDRALDAMLERPGRAIVVAAGNGGAAARHAGGPLLPGAPQALRWEFLAGDETDNTLRIFLPAPGGQLQFNCDVADPTGTVVLQSPASANPNVDLLDDGQHIVGALYAGLVTAIGAAPLQLVELRIRPSGARSETWTVTLQMAANAQPGLRWDAWIDRDDRAKSASSEDRARVTASRFKQEDAEAARSLSALACGMRTICVGAFDETSPGVPVPTGFTAVGPTRDDRQKPDVAAPGASVTAARAYGGRVFGLYRPLAGTLGGTSAAAPHVAGVVALIMQARPHLTADQIRTVLCATTQVPNAATRAWDPRLGFGIVDAAAAVSQAMTL